MLSTKEGGRRAERRDMESPSLACRLGCPDPLESPSLVRMPVKVGEDGLWTDGGVGW